MCSQDVALIDAVYWEVVLGSWIDMYEVRWNRQLQLIGAQVVGETVD